MNTFPKNFKTCFDVLTSRDRGWLEYSLAAAIVSGGRVLSVGMNKQKFNSIIDVFKTNEWSNIHAEVDAILRVRNKIDLTGSKIYVARMTVDGDIRNAMPCEMCVNILRTYGIKRAIYTIDDSSYGVLKI